MLLQRMTYKFLQRETYKFLDDLFVGPSTMIEWDMVREIIHKCGRPMSFWGKSV